MDSGRQRITYLMRLIRWIAKQDLGELTESLLRTTRERKLWSAMISLVLCQRIKKKLPVLFICCFCKFIYVASTTKYFFLNQIFRHLLRAD